MFSRKIALGLSVVLLTSSPAVAKSVSYGSNSGDSKADSTYAVGSQSSSQKSSSAKGSKFIVTTQKKSNHAANMTSGYGKDANKHGKKRHEVSPVPLPATGAALLAALGGLGLMRRRKKTA
jgi:cobalamin biosynthesis Mg chelatase CobN